MLIEPMRKLPGHGPSLGRAIILQRAVGNTPRAEDLDGLPERLSGQ
jgi:hypothetical protein